MSLFSKQPRTTKHDYSMSTYQDSQSDEYESQDDTIHCQDDDFDSSPLIRQKTRLVKGTWFLKISVILLGASTLFLGIYAALARAQLLRLKKESEKWNGNLGEDPSEFVPQGIGGPLRLTYYDEKHPYYIPQDAFEDFDESLNLIQRVWSMHNSSNVLANRQYAKWYHPDGSVTGLAPFFSWKSTRQMYTIRGFHQFTCVLVIAEEYTHRVHTNMTSRWGPRHVAHCLNTLRDAVMCMADATPMTFVNGFQMGYITDEQAHMCRDWEGLRAWANDPQRGVRTRRTDDEADGELGPGSLYDFEYQNEIVPFPDLTEEERSGLA